MKVGMLTAPMGDVTIEKLIEFAKGAGISAFEIHAAKSAHFDPGDADACKKVADLCGQAGIEITSLANYGNITPADEAQRKAAQEGHVKLLDVCAAMGVKVLCCGAGLPPAGMKREDAIRKLSAPFYKDLAARAADKGLKLALENWYATNIQHLGLWHVMFEEVPAENFGLNFDPSHLLWQGIDYLHAVEIFGKRIFHTHAKDTEVLAHRLAVTGNQSDGWWRFVIPGLGDVRWGAYISRLRGVGYDGVLSIEHEDGAVGREEGFKIGAQYLSQFM